MHPWRTSLARLALTGTTHWPWRVIDEQDAEDVIGSSTERNILPVGLSGHDRTPSTFERFAAEHGEGFTAVTVGDVLSIAAARSLRQ